MELDNYNREYGVKKETRTKKPEESPSVALLTEDKLHLPGQLGSEDRSTTTRISRRSRIAIFAENQTGHRNTYTHHGNHNAMIARRQDILSESAKAKL